MITTHITLHQPPVHPKAALDVWPTNFRRIPHKISRSHLHAVGKRAWTNTSTQAHTHTHTPARNGQHAHPTNARTWSDARLRIRPACARVDRQTIWAPDRLYWVLHACQVAAEAASLKPIPCLRSAAPFVRAVLRPLSVQCSPFRFRAAPVLHEAPIVPNWSWQGASGLARDVASTPTHPPPHPHPHTHTHAHTQQVYTCSRNCAYVWQRSFQATKHSYAHCGCGRTQMCTCSHAQTCSSSYMRARAPDTQGKPYGKACRTAVQQPRKQPLARNKKQK